MSSEKSETAAKPAKSKKAKAPVTAKQLNAAKAKLKGAKAAKIAASPKATKRTPKGKGAKAGVVPPVAAEVAGS